MGQCAEIRVERNDDCGLVKLGLTFIMDVWYINRLNQFKSAIKRCFQ